jgi:hypothetical protein
VSFLPNPGTEWGESTMNGTHTFATTNVVAQRRASSASSSTGADPRTGFGANLRFRTEADESRIGEDERRIGEDERRIDDGDPRAEENEP